MSTHDRTHAHGGAGTSGEAPRIRRAARVGPGASLSGEGVRARGGWLRSGLARGVGTALLALLSSGAAAAAQSDRFALARFELSGPLSDFSCEAGPNARSVWARDVAAGERLRVELAAPLERASAAQAPPAVRTSGAGEARFVGWDHEAGAERERAWTRLPMGLRARPRLHPGVGPTRRTPAAAVWLAAAGAVLAIAARGRPWVALALGLGSGLAAAALSRPPDWAPRRLRVIEIDGPSGRAVAVDVARDALHGARIDDLRWESSPPHAVVTAVAAGAGGAFDLASPGAVLRCVRAFEGEERRLSADLNGWGVLSPAWCRGPDGGWRRAEVWPGGAPWPERGASDETGPPGWIQPALPMGAAVVVGRWRSAPARAAGDADEVWVRWIGP